MITEAVNPQDIPGLNAEEELATLATKPGDEADHHDMPWYASLFMALGAWITALLGIATVIAIVELFTDSFNEDLFLIIGLLMLATSLSICNRVNSLFGSQVCLVMILAAQGLTVGASWVISEKALAAGLVSFVITSLIIWRHPVITLSFLSSFASSMVLAIGLSETGFAYWVDTIAVISLVTGACLWLRPPAGRDWTGVAFALLLALPLLGIGLHLEDSDSRFINDLLIQHERAPLAAGWLTKFTILGISLYALRQIKPVWHHQQTIIASAVLSVLILAQPLGGAAATGLMVLGYLMASPAMMVLTGLAQIVAIGQFYYELDVSLLMKSGILAALGAIALIGWWALWGGQRLRTEPDDQIRHKPRSTTIPRAAIIGLTAAMITGIAAQAVISREAIIADGQQILLPLAPVDPRSLMQGDYMILRLDPEVLPEAGTTPRIGSISLDIAQDGTVIGRSKPTEGNGTISLDRLPGASDQIALNYHPSRGGFGRRGRLGYGIDSFFFQEGHAALYQNADYAVLRVGENGQAVLIGLADENKQLITPD